MPLPTLEKTWQFAHVSNSASGVQLNDLKDIFLRIKDAAKAFDDSPLTVVGSSNSLSANMTGTDLLVDQDDMVYSATAHSWIVLGLPEIGPGVQLCFDFKYSNSQYGDVVVTPTGFSGGSVTARPTAADEQVLRAGEILFGQLGDGGGAGAQLWAHLMLSTDGECFRVLVMNNGVATGFLLVDKPGSPATGWDTPMIARYTSQPDNTSNTLMGLGNWSDQSGVFKAVGPVAAMPLLSIFESAIFFNATVADAFDAANQISGEYPLMRVGLWHDTTVGQRGRHGFVHDLFFTCPVLQNGDTMPADGTKQFVVIGDAVLPCDGTDWALG